MNHYHHPSHWIAVALVAGLALLAFEAAGQTNAQSNYQGRPAMAGAQAGTGAMAGPPLGGIGLQGTEGAQLNVRPATLASIRDRVTDPVPCNGPTASAAQNPTCLPQVSDERFERRTSILGINNAQQR
jgi:hypothetical protein